MYPAVSIKDQILDHQEDRFSYRKGHYLQVIRVHTDTNLFQTGTGKASMQTTISDLQQQVAPPMPQLSVQFM